MDATRERRRIKSRIGVVPQETNLDGDLTVRENLAQQARYFGIDSETAATRATELLDFALLAERADDRIHALSGGMKRRLLVSRALMGDPGARRPRRADHRARSPGPPRGLGGARSAAAPRRHPAPHHPLHGGGRAALRPSRDHGRGADRHRRPPARPGPRARRARGARAHRLDEGCDAERLVGSLDGRIQGHDLSERTLMLYAEDAEAVLAEFDHEAFPTESALVRRATLEDVFLRLTGRSLREVAVAMLEEPGSRGSAPPADARDGPRAAARRGDLAPQRPGLLEALARRAAADLPRPVPLPARARLRARHLRRDDQRHSVQGLHRSRPDRLGGDVVRRRSRRPTTSTSG